MELLFSAMTEHLTVSPDMEDVWEKAQQRVSLYLRLMRVPSLESLELALEAMKQARQGTAVSVHPLTRAIVALRQVLTEHESRQERKTIDLLKITRIPLPSLTGREVCGGVRSRPPINRSSMVPEKVR
jgi:hypothetical protein